MRRLIVRPLIAALATLALFAAFAAATPASEHAARDLGVSMLAVAVLSVACCDIIGGATAVLLMTSAPLTAAIATLIASGLTQFLVVAPIPVLLAAHAAVRSAPDAGVKRGWAAVPVVSALAAVFAGACWSVPLAAGLVALALLVALVAADICRPGWFAKKPE